MLRNIILACLTLVPTLAACSAATDGSVSTEGEVPGSRISEEALKGGCRVVCPKCVPNQPCPKYACTIECPAKTTPCGDTVCTGGMECCNASCGTCVQPGGFCTQQYCEPTTECTVTGLCIEGYSWDAVKCECVPVSTCTTIGLCIEGYVWSDKDCACVPVPSECTSDADCHLEDNYCGGCNCLALASGETGPTCTDPVQCFAQPCGFGQTAACVGGQCVVASGTTQ